MAMIPHRKEKPRNAAGAERRLLRRSVYALLLFPSSAWPAGLSAEQQSLSDALAQACPSARGSLANRCQQLQALSPAQQQQAIASLMPYQFLPQTGLPIKLWPKQILSRSQRSLAGADTANGFDSNGRWLGGAAGDEPLRDEPLSLIVQGKFQTGSKNLKNGGFSADFYELTLGADYRLTDQLVLGGAFAYSYGETLMDRDTGNMRSDIYRGLLFGNYTLPEDVYVNWLGIYSHYDNTILRKFAYPGFVGNASSTPSTDIYSVTASIGKDLHYQEWLASPYLRAEYSYLEIAAYQESSRSGLAYQTGAQADDSFVLIPGIQIQRAFSMDWGILTPTLRFEYEHQFRNDKQTINLRLSDAAAGTGNFFLASGNPDRNYFNLGASLAAGLPGGVAAFLHYENRVGQAHLSNHILELGIRVPFE